MERVHGGTGIVESETLRPDWDDIPQATGIDFHRASPLRTELPVGFLRDRLQVWCCSHVGFGLSLLRSDPPDVGSRFAEATTETTLLP